jgi:hypothetical protein
MQLLASQELSSVNSAVPQNATIAETQVLVRIRLPNSKKEKNGTSLTFKSVYQ